MMPHVVANTTQELKQVHELLAMSLPSYRLAYSDRTAWRMACLSELVYLRFNQLFKGGDVKDFFLDKIRELVGKNNKESLVKLIDAIAYDPEEELNTLQGDLTLLNSTLVKTFDHNGTQAIIVSFDNHLVLAFRGTEATSIKDIKSDTKAKTVECETGGRIHSGFSEAYNQIAIDIQETLNEKAHEDKPLFITGHSLGGALATIAAKKLTHKGGIAACYTYGSPRVGDDTWAETIKTPVYRVVNAADAVTMLPPGDETISVLGWLAAWIPYIGKSARSILISNFGGYLHCGDMRYLTNVREGMYQDVKLHYAVSFFRRIKMLVIKKLPLKRFLADHSIRVYRKKLAVVARNRNLKT